MKMIHSFLEEILDRYILINKKVTFPAYKFTKMASPSKQHQTVRSWTMLRFPVIIICP